MVTNGYMGELYGITTFPIPESYCLKNHNNYKCSGITNGSQSS